jgi:hypothetical protein
LIRNATMPLTSTTASATSSQAFDLRDMSVPR